MASGINDSHFQKDSEYDRNARKTLKSWRTQTKTLSEAHNEARAYYKKVGNSLTIASLVLGAFTSSTAIFTGGSSAGVSAAINWQWNVALGCMGIASTVFVAINTVFTPGVREAAHRECENSYNKLTREITAQLLADTSCRGDMLFSSLWRCLQHFREKLDELEDNSPPIPSHIRQIATDGEDRRRSARASTGSEIAWTYRGSDSLRSPLSFVDVSPSGRFRVSFDGESTDLPSPGPVSIVLEPLQEETAEDQKIRENAEKENRP